MGRSLGIRGDGRGDLEGAFLPGIAEIAVSLSVEVDPNVKQNASKIYDELRREELRFVQTLERGDKLLNKLLADALAPSNLYSNGALEPRLAGKDIFLLYDTVGFPKEITEEVARERGVGVDLEGFEAEMEIQRNQSQTSHNYVKLTVGDAMAEFTGKIQKSKFLGYQMLESESSAVALLSKGVPISEAGKGQEIELILEQTPFYAESGGQIGDHGTITGVEGQCKFVVSVTNVQKAGSGLILHSGLVEEGKITLGARVTTRVDGMKRRRAMSVSDIFGLGKSRFLEFGAQRLVANLGD